jgi:pimeloyl-ACP methyl ester carboxylesterase
VPKIFAAVTLFISIWLLVVSLSFAAQADTDIDLTVIDTMVTVEGIGLHFQVIEGGGPTILLESGGGMNLTEWKDLAPRLALETGATVVSYSRAGFGQSDLPKVPCDMRVEAAWLWDALGKLGLGRDIVLVGHSYGGWMVRLEASMYPDDILGIVFVDPFSAEFVDILGIEYLDDHPMAGKLPFDTSDLSKLDKSQLALVRMVKGGLGPKMDIMKKTTVPEGIPVVIIASGLQTLPKAEEQEAWDNALERMAASIDGAVLITAEQSNHMIPWNQPDIIVEAVVDVVGKVK